MYKDEIARFKAVHGHEPDLINPQSYSEKIVCKKLFDRNPLLPLTTDKLKARDYIVSCIDAEAIGHLVPLIWYGQKAKDIPFNKLPDRYIIKPNNGSGRYILKDDDYLIDKYFRLTTLSDEQIIEICGKWFRTVHGAKWHEWAYSQIEPLIVIEELIKVGGELPNDLRLFMFDGKMRLATITSFRNYYANYYNEDWKLLNVNKVGRHNIPNLVLPDDLDKMVGYAQRLSKPFDFVRIDFLLADKFYFSELTHYPGSGLSVFEPKEFDYKLGNYWKLGDYS